MHHLGWLGEVKATQAACLGSEGIGGHRGQGQGQASEGQGQGMRVGVRAKGSEPGQGRDQGQGSELGQSQGWCTVSESRAATHAYPSCSAEVMTTRRLHVARRPCGVDR